MSSCDLLDHRMMFLSLESARIAVKSGSRRFSCVRVLINCAILLVSSTSCAWLSPSPPSPQIVISSTTHTIDKILKRFVNDRFTMGERNETSDRIRNAETEIARAICSSERVDVSATHQIMKEMASINATCWNSFLRSYRDASLDTVCYYLWSYEMRHDYYGRKDEYYKVELQLRVSFNKNLEKCADASIQIEINEKPGP